MNNYGLPGKDAGINPANFRKAQESICNSGNHQANGIHVSCQQDPWTGFRSLAAPQAMQAAQRAGADFIHKGAPGIGYHLADGCFVAR